LIGRVWRNLGTAALSAAVVLVVLLGVGRGDTISEVRAAAGKYEQDIVGWEITHFLDKWVYLATGFVFQRSDDDEARPDAVAEFFALGEELRRVSGELERTVAAAPASRARTVDAVQDDLDDIQRRRDELTPLVEETMEAIVSAVVDDLGIIDHFGPIRWPPVDFAFEDGAHVLVRSPRDEIVRLHDLLLEPDVNVLEQAALEDDIENISDNTSAFVVRISGVGTYPAQVSPSFPLHTTLEFVSHEWLHHWLFFRPLGRRVFDGGEITSINETVANLFQEEVGDLALTRLTGEVFERTPWQPPTVRTREAPPEDVFDFRREMRRTRVRLEELLENAAVDEAERYLEERRLEFVANGHNLRKLNNAWFAFNGTYADSEASISPIEGQLRTVRADSADLAEFLDRMGGITRPEQLEEMALAAGWVPIDRATGLPLEGGEAP
jgi:hypothetical protein